MNDDKSTELYNKTGNPFQYKCLSILKEIDWYQGISEFPFTHPPSEGVQLGKSSQIDILAVKLSNQPRRSQFIFDGPTLFFIECKKANPKIKHWVFTKDKNCLRKPTFLLKISEELKEGITFLKSRIINLGFFEGLGYNHESELDYCLQGNEFNETLTEINRNQEDNIYKALLQANHSLNALFYKTNSPDILNIEGLNFPDFERILFLPIVLTTANLLIADYDPKEVEIKTGEIDKSKIKFIPKDWLTYEFPLPDYLKYSGESRDNKLDIERITTFVINANCWENFLKNFSLNIPPNIFKK